jgi:hypothetical protein
MILSLSLCGEEHCEESAAGCLRGFTSYYCLLALPENHRTLAFYTPASTDNHRLVSTDIDWRRMASTIGLVLPI